MNYYVITGKNKYGREITREIYCAPVWLTIKAREQGIVEIINVSISNPPAWFYYRNIKEV